VRGVPNRAYFGNMTPAPALPVDAILGELGAALQTVGSAVLQAPPGAGKTTRVPLALLGLPWLAQGRILMLEPRRLATRAAARRMAATLGESVGQTVGYRVRQDTRVGPRTRVEVVTEGVLTRLVQSDPALEGIGLVIFDEFHERSIHAALGLALTLHSRVLLRPDLRVLVMSATLDSAPIAALLGGAPVVTSEGRIHPVDTRHRPPRVGSRPESAVAAVVREAMAEHAGDVLVFLPGVGEIRRAERTLRESNLSPDVDLLRLHGNLPAEAQDRVIGPSPPGRRKVVLATSIAETSLTIEGIRVVVDSGLARVPRYSPRTGMTRLATVRVSLASAEQRRGRAARLGPGFCYRLWPPAEDRTLIPRATPEILEADLASLALELAAAGVIDPGGLAWLDPPPSAALAEARVLLTELGALDRDQVITPRGRSIAGLPLHPRLAHMVLRGTELGAGFEACELAALLTERDLFRHGQGVPDADIRSRLDVLRGTTLRGDVDQEVLRRARRDVIALTRAVSVSGAATAQSEKIGLLLALAYPDRIARRRQAQSGRYLLRNGVGAFVEPQALAASEWLAVAELDGRARESRILLAAPLDEADLWEHFGPQIEREDRIEWDSATRSVTASRRERLGALVLRESMLPEPEPVRVSEALLSGIRREGLGLLPWTQAALSLRERVRFLQRLDPTWPDFSDQGLAGTLEQWLGPHLIGMRRLDDLGQLDLAGTLGSALTWQQRAMLEQWAPIRIEVPSGSWIPVDYSDPETPVLAVRIQELFGWRETPRIAQGRVPLTLHLLSPAGRPVQVTGDLAGFWRTMYFEVRKELRGRYPKHSWPDDPLVAEPTRRVKRGRR
jgi:ATP-dependent helicase HrpB